MGSVDADAIDLIRLIPDPHSNLTAEFDSLTISSLDPLYFNNNIEFFTDIGIGDERDEFDFDFTLENLYMDEDSGDIFAGMVGAGGGGGCGGVGVVSADLGSPVDSKDSNSVENSEERKESTVVEVFDCACTGKERFNDEFETEKFENYHSSERRIPTLVYNKDFDLPTKLQQSLISPEC